MRGDGRKCSKLQNYCQVCWQLVSFLVAVKWNRKSHCYLFRELNPTELGTRLEKSCIAENISKDFLLAVHFNWLQLTNSCFNCREKSSFGAGSRLLVLVEIHFSAGYGSFKNSIWCSGFESLYSHSLTTNSIYPTVFLLCNCSRFINIFCSH